MTLSATTLRAVELDSLMYRARFSWKEYLYYRDEQTGTERSAERMRRALVAAVISIEQYQAMAARWPLAHMQQLRRAECARQRRGLS